LQLQAVEVVVVAELAVQAVAVTEDCFQIPLLQTQVRLALVEAEAETLSLTAQLVAEAEL
jgi:hypothetical protein